MWTTRRRQREREAKSGIRLEEIREEKAMEVEDRCCPSDEEARSRTSGFQSETSDHEDKAIHPRRNRGTGAFHRLTRRRPHACSIHTCTSAQVWCDCVRTHACACGWLHCFWTWKPAVASTLRGHATSLEKKEKAGPPGRSKARSSMWAGRGPAQRANDLHALEISLTIGPEAKQGSEEGGIFFGWYGCWSYVGQRSWMMERWRMDRDLMSFWFWLAYKLR